MKHTPGPWHQRSTFNMGDDVIAIVQPGSMEQDEANACLIAAAPDLLETMKIFAAWPRKSLTVDGILSSDPSIGLANVRRFARAAIAKAEERRK